MKTKLTAKGISLLIEYTSLKFIRAYKDWMNTKSQRDWQVVEIYSDILTKAGTDIATLRAHALTRGAK